VKRFYKNVSWCTAGDGFAVTLDGRPMQTPGRRAINLPTEPLAQALAHEWDEQADEIVPHSMPLTRLVTTALDRVATHRSGVLDDLAGYGAADLVCYRAKAPAELVAWQAQTWQPLVDWVSHRYDATLTVTLGIVPVAQSETAMVALSSALPPLTDLELIALHTITTATGSLVIGLAVLEGELHGEAAWAAGLADELYIFEVWGEDAEAKLRHETLKGDILAAERLLYLMGRLSVRALAAP
jgi:chaperone required for assembly of F1-ATPase